MILLLVLLLSACHLPTSSQVDRVALGLAQTGVARTQAALTQADRDAGSGPGQPVQEAAAPVVPPTATLTARPLATATQTLTPTLSPPMVTVSCNTNCRTGPGDPYEIVGALLEDEQAEVIGISSDGGTWIIQNPDGDGECWLWGYYASVSGPIEGLPVRTPPPTPTPQFTWAGAWTSYHAVPGDWLFVEQALTVTVSGQTFNGVLDLGFGDTRILTGTISEDYLSVSGSWTSAFNQGNFKFYALGTNQFQGFDYDTKLWEWCGARGGAARPSPCLKQ